MDRRLLNGIETRKRILARAANIASVEGLEGLSIGRLAEELEMSKAGVFAHFGSKQELQLSTLEAAREIFTQEVLRAPGGAVDRPLLRLYAVCEAWLDYVVRDVFPGGCFFAAAASELDGRPGPVRERLVDMVSAWLQVVRTSIRHTIEHGELRDDVDPDQLVFELQSLVLGTNWHCQLLAMPDVSARARLALYACLSRHANKRGKQVLKRAERRHPSHAVPSAPAHRQGGSSASRRLG
jgi:AcrR family transcriptional regulator